MGPGLPPTADQSRTRPVKMAFTWSRSSGGTLLLECTITAIPSSAMTCSVAGARRSPMRLRASAFDETGERACAERRLARGCPRLALDRPGALAREEGVDQRGRQLPSDGVGAAQAEIRSPRRGAGWLRPESRPEQESEGAGD